MFGLDLCLLRKVLSRVRGWLVWKKLFLYICLEYAYCGDV
jgi:hypothetical protein